MELNGAHKKILIEHMQTFVNSKIQNSRNDFPTDTQVRRYSSVAISCDCVEEFMNYLQYQCGREKVGSKIKESIRELIEKELPKLELKIPEIKENDELHLKALAFYFGYMSRYLKYQ